MIINIAEIEIEAVLSIYFLFRPDYLGIRFEAFSCGATILSPPPLCIHLTNDATGKNSRRYVPSVTDMEGFGYRESTVLERTHQVEPVLAEDGPA